MGKRFFSWLAWLLIVALALTTGSVFAQAGTPAITITSPVPGATVIASGSFTVTGTATAVPGDNVAVQARDATGLVLAETSVTAAQGTGVWQATLTVNVTAGTAGSILAYSVSPDDGTVIASASINVTFGQVSAPAITISSPAPGTIVANAGNVSVSGSATSLFEGSMVVQALDSAGAVIAERAITVEGTSLGGTGTWQTELAVNIAAGTLGNIYAFTTSPVDGSVEASATVSVIYGQAPARSLNITLPAANTVVVTGAGFSVSGTSSNLLDSNVTVQARDAASRVLAQAVVASSAATGSGTWTAALATYLTADTPGTLYAFSTSPDDGSVIASDVINVTFQANCTVRTDWPAVTVEAGDNLFRIAQRVGSNVNELAQANCLVNPGVIVVGTQVRVPRLPVGEAAVTITTPIMGAAVATGAPVTVSGTTTGLAETQVTVQVLVAPSNVLAEQTVAIIPAAAELTGVWTTSLVINATPGTSGRIVAHVASPVDGSIIASDEVDVVFGPPGEAETGPAVAITQPADGAVVSNVGPISVGGTGRGLFEGTVVVRVLDENGIMLSEQPTTMASPDVGQPGTWQISLPVTATVATRGQVVAYATSARDGSIVALDAVNVVFGAPLTGPSVTITSPMPFEMLAGVPVTVTGQASGLTTETFTVSALDSGQNVLVEVPAMLSAATAGSSGTWAATLNFALPAGTHGQIVAVATDPTSGDAVAQAVVAVGYGPGSADAPFVSVDAPLYGTRFAAGDPVAVGGQVGGLAADAALMVQVIDAGGNIRASQAVTPDSTGQWGTQFALAGITESTAARVVAFFTDPQTGAVVASDAIAVVLGG